VLREISEKRICIRDRARVIASYGGAVEPPLGFLSGYRSGWGFSSELSVGPPQDESPAQPGDQLNSPECITDLAKSLK